MIYPYKRVDITPEMMKLAEKRYSNFLDANKNTRLAEKNKKIKRTGFTGEQIVKSVWPVFEDSGTTDFDLILNGIRFDVKGTGCNVQPQSNHDGSVFDFEKNDKIDYYIFTRIRNDFKVGWIMGFINRKKFLELSTYITAGTKNQNFEYESDRRTIQYGLISSPMGINKALALLKGSK